MARGTFSESSEWRSYQTGMKRIGIFGTSGMARETGDLAWELGYEPIYVAKDEVAFKDWVFESEAMLEADVLRYSDIPFAVGIGDSSVRENISQRYFCQLRFINLIHSSATFGHMQRDELSRSRGVIIGAGARFTNNIKVGNFSIINQNVTVAHDVVIGAFVHLASGCAISGNVHIGDHCWIGAGAVVNQGSSIARLHIGCRTTIGSGAVVIRSCDPCAVYVGVPARRIR